MWGRWFCNVSGVGTLNRRVSTISRYSYAQEGRFHPFASMSWGLEESVKQCRGGQGKASPLSDLSNVMKRGISSSAFASMSADSGSGGGSTTDSSFFVGNGDNKSKRGEETISSTEAKRLMRLVNVEALKTNLANEGKEVISYSELLEACETVGVAKTHDEAAVFARALDDAGVLLLFRNKVYLHPDKVVDLVRRAVPLALTADNDPTREELKRLQKQKEEIDVQAHKQVRRMLWGGLTLFVAQIGLFFRLTFWEFSWDVMEPIAFFTTTSGLVIGYAYFMFTSRDPTYLDLMQSLFLSRQRKLLKKTNFDVERFKELQKKSSMASDASTSIKNRVGVHLNLEDALNKD